MKLLAGILSLFTSFFFGSDAEIKTEVPIYEKIPNKISIEGIGKSARHVGQFLYSLNNLAYFDSVKLINSTEDSENGGQVFSIVLELKEGVVFSE